MAVLFNGRNLCSVNDETEHMGEKSEQFSLQELFEKRLAFEC